MLPAYRVFVISSRRPECVHKFKDLDVTYVVRDQQDVHQYQMEAGHPIRIMIGGSLMKSRNTALDISRFNKDICVELSDDISSSIWMLDGATHRDKHKISLKEAVEYMVKELADSPYYLAGASPTGNPMNSSIKEPYKTRAFIVGDFIAVKPTELRFDENMTLKEDYDYTLQHIKQYKGVLRLELLLPKFAHRTNSGGAVDYRTISEEEKNIAYLEQKWGTKIIRRRKDKPNEILMKLPTRRYK